MSKQAGISIQTKVNLSLLVVFVLILISSLTTIFRSETGLVREVAKTTARNTADSYFDSINILMLSGAMGNRQALQQKILSNPDLTEARIIRGKAVSDTYGPGLADAGIRDEYDRRALRGEAIVEELDDEQGHRLVVVTPMQAQQNYKGTNCLTCHQVSEGTVLGAVRVTYSFTSLDQQIAANLARVAALELGLFVAGILVIGLLLRRLVVKPIQALSQTIGEIERGSDLSLRAPVGSPDEIGQMSIAFNGMLQTLHDSLQQVSRTAQMLGSSSHQIGEIAELANRAVHLQQSQTGSVAAAMAQMEVATRSVEASAGNTVSASDQALKESRDGTRITDDAIAAIEQLQQNIGNATGVIVQLDDQSEKVGQVLDVIQRIAEQTNLLALNAAIEAARAGEQGRGFAVVADEVRTLATRTRHSTDEIQVIIQQLQQDAKDAVNAMQASLDSAGNGVQQVRQTADALGRIATEVQAINRMNHEVAASVREQTQMAGSVERSVGDISQAAEQTASRADQLSRVAGELNSHAGQLSTMLKRFRL